MNPYAIIAEVLVFIALVGGAAFAVRGYNQTQRHDAVATDRAEAAEVVSKALQESADDKQKKLDAANKVANQRTKEKQDAERNLQVLWENYQALAKTDKDAGEWLPAPVPPSIRLRRGPPSAASAGVPVGVRGAGGPAPAAASGRP